jgi:hypothetical protein
VDAGHWLSRLRSELERKKLPSDYVARLVAELSDHLVDFLEDRMSTDAKDLHGVFQRLGEPGRIAARAAQEYRRARFSRRHPVVTFVVLPILALPLLWIGCVLLMLAFVKLLGLETGKVDTASAVWQWADACAPYVVLGMLLVPIALAAVFFSRLAIAAGVNWKWTLAACALVAVLGGMAMTKFVLPTEHTRGELQVGLALGPHPSASQMLQFLLPLAIGGWTIWRQIKGRAGQAHRA